jgi:hypothetical protein
MAFSKARAQLAFAYVSALQLASIRVMTSATGLPTSWLEVDLKAGPEAEDAAGRVMFDTVWFRKSGHAELVAQQVFTVLDAEPGGPIALPAVEVRDVIINECGNLGAEWRTTAQIVATAEQAVDEVERNIEALNKSGGLRPLNARYKAYRLAMQGTGEAAVSYGDYLQRYKVKAVKLIAGNIASGSDKFAGFSAIAPTLISDMDDTVRRQPVRRNTAAPHSESFNLSHHATNRDYRERLLKT